MIINEVDTSSFTKSQKIAWDLVCKGEDNILIFGAGGVGKSYLIDKIVERYPDSTVVTAMTGAASTLINGMTLHRAMSMPTGFPTKQDLRKVHPTFYSLFSKGAVKRIIVDEASMLTAGGMFAFYERLQRAQKKTKNREAHKIQVILVGDFLQARDIVNPEEQQLFKEHYGTDRMFKTKEFKDLNFKCVELREVVRQADPTYKYYLECIRWKKDNYKDAVDWLNEKCANKPCPSDSVVIAPTKKKVEHYNNLQFKLNPNPPAVYRATIDGDFKPRDYPCPPQVFLKVGARVMIIKNDPEDQWVNGSTGEVTALTADGPIVRLDHSGYEVLVPEAEWQQFEYYEGENEETKEPELCKRTKAVFRQVPILLCYAITGHKAQGRTLESAVVDFANGVSWSAGLPYVMISRTRTVEGLYFKRKLRTTDISVDQEVIEWLQTISWENDKDNEDIHVQGKDDEKPTDQSSGISFESISVDTF